MTNHFQIPIYRPDLTGNEKRYVNECLDSSWISSKGKFVSKFETRFAEKINVAQATAVCNGTVALHLALVALGVGVGDEVIVPTLTYIASVNAISYTGAVPIFVDSDRVSWQINPSEIEKKITTRTKAIVVVHLYGQSCDMKPIINIAKEKGLYIIEDCAEALGTCYGSDSVGSFGDISTYSFYGNKTITTGEGGMVISNDLTLMDRAIRLKGQGLALYREYWHEIIGYNYRMTNLAAAIGLAQLERLESTLLKKREIALSYMSHLKHLPVEFQTELTGTTHSYWMVSFLVPKVVMRDELRIHLASKGIETRPVFYPVHTMPMYSQAYKRYPVGEDISLRGINLPSWPGLTAKEIDYICSEIEWFFKML